MNSSLTMTFWSESPRVEQIMGTMTHHLPSFVCHTSVNRTCHYICILGKYHSVSQDRLMWAESPHLFFFASKTTSPTLYLIRMQAQGIKPLSSAWSFVPACTVITAISRARWITWVFKQTMVFMNFAEKTRPCWKQSSCACVNEMLGKHRATLWRAEVVQRWELRNWIWQRKPLLSKIRWLLLLAP